MRVPAAEVFGVGEGMFTGADAVTWNELNSCESRKTCSNIVLDVWM